jgi:predicted DNA-binding transcriptional regulator AlpA
MGLSMIGTGRASVPEQQAEFFDSASLAAFLGVSVKAVVKWRDQGRLPGQVRCGRIHRFRRSDIEKKLLSGELLLPANR